MEAQSFKDLIIQHMDSIEQCIVERALHEQEIQNRLKRLNERKLQIQECKVQEVKGSDASSGDTDSSGIVSDKGDDQCLENQSNTSRNESNEVPYTVEYNVFAVETQHSEQPENINDTSLMEMERVIGSVSIPDLSDMCDNDIQNDQNVVECEDERVTLANLIVNLKLDIDENKKTEFERHRFASQVGVPHDLTKPVTPHSWPQVRKSSFAKPYDVNAPGPSRKSPKHVSFLSPRESVGSNDIVHNYYIEEAKKKAQLQKDKPLNTKPSVQQSARLPNTANGNKPKPRNFNQQPRNWPPSISSHVSNRTINIAEPPRNKNPFLKSEDLACLPCKKCIYSANHDECILQYLSKVNSCASSQTKDAQSYKTTKRYIPVEKKSESNNHGRQIPIGQRIFTHVGLTWIPIKKPVETSYNMNDSASPLGKKTHNPNTTICANSSSLSAGEDILMQRQGSLTKTIGMWHTKECLRRGPHGIAFFEMECGQ
ncbi:hypothetical protein Tco_1194608 [Tanacetum coccineum]